MPSPSDLKIGLVKEMMVLAPDDATNLLETLKYGPPRCGPAYPVPNGGGGGRCYLGADRGTDRGTNFTTSVVNLDSTLTIHTESGDNRQPAELMENSGECVS